MPPPAAGDGPFVSSDRRFGFISNLAEAFDVDGVTIDLRSAELDAKRWEPRERLGDETLLAPGLRLAFPWTAALRRIELEAAGNWIEARRGDLVCIAEPKRRIFDVERGFATFEIEADRSIMEVELNLVRADGSEAPIPGVMVLVRRGATALELLDFDHGRLKLALIAQLEAATGLPDIEAIASAIARSQWGGPPPKLSDAVSRDHRLALAALTDARCNEHAWVSFGFHMARAQAGREAIPFAKKARARGQIAGLGRAKQQLENQAAWRAHAKRVRASAIEHDPKLARNADGAARAVDDLWTQVAWQGPGDRLPAPSRKTLRDFFLQKYPRKTQAEPS
jgi:hypothetical protein